MPQICERNWSNLADGTLIINYFSTVIQINISSSSSFRHFICSGKTQAYRGTVNVKQLEPDSKEYSLTASLFWWLCDRVPDLQSGGCGFESRPGLLRTKVYSAFHPSGVDKWVPAATGKAKAGMAHSDCGRTCGRAGKTVKSLRTRVIPERFCGGDSLRRCSISSVCTFTFTFISEYYYYY